MPGITSPAVLKNDDVTSVTFTGVQPSSGDKVPAVWQNTAVGTAFEHRPTLTYSSRDDGSKSARWITLSFTYPQISTNSTTGIVSVVNKATAQATLRVPKAMAAADSNEFFVQFVNLLAHADMKTQLKTLFSPT